MNLEAARDVGASHYSAHRKMGLLKIWRISHGQTLSGITSHEMEQWDALEKTYGLKGLKVTVPLENMRVTSPPALPFAHAFYNSDRIAGIWDIGGMEITSPKLPYERLLFYLTVRSLTEIYGICTHADLAHTLWPPRRKALPTFHILFVWSNKVNKTLDGCIKNIPGRGFYYSVI